MANVAAAGVGAALAGAAGGYAAGEKIISEVTAKRSVNIVIRNESNVTLDKPEWTMKHGHAASDGLPPQKVVGNTNASDPKSPTIPSKIRFVKARRAIVGCEGVLTYRYNDGSNDDLCYVAIKFAVPQAGKNRCTLAILDCNEYDTKSSSVKDKALFEYISRKKLTEKRGKKLIDKIKSKGGKWMEIEDKERQVVFACTMSGEDMAVIELVVRNIPSKKPAARTSADQPSESKDVDAPTSTDQSSKEDAFTSSNSHLQSEHIL